MPPSDISMLRARIPRPVRRELERTKLLTRLRAYDGQLVVLVAPAGYGKTTMLAQFARTHEGQVIWLTLDHDDSDPRTLCEHLGAAIQAVLPTLDLSSWRAVRTQSLTGEELALALAQDLNSSTTNLDIILDGSEVLRAAAEATLQRLLDSLAEGHRLFLAGRSEPNLELARRVARGDALLIGLQHLAFSQAETAARLENPDIDAGKVHQQLEGWPVGVALIGSGAALPLTPADLIRDVLNKLPPSLKLVLPSAGVLETWSEEGAARFGLDLPPGWLREVRQSGLPLVPLGGSFRPHQLLREVLDLELRRQPVRHHELHVKTGTLAEAEGDPLRALQHFQLAGADKRALALAAQLAETYENRWEYRLVRQVLEGFPQHLLPDGMQRLLGYALLETGEADRGEQILYALRQAGGNDPALLSSLAVLASRAGQPERFLALVDEGLSGSLDPLGRRQFLILKAHALRQIGEPAGAVTAANEAAATATTASDMVNVAAANVVLEHAYYALGQREACEAALHTAMDLYTRLGMTSRLLVLENDLANLLREQRRYAEALEVVDRALPRAELERSTDLALLLETSGDIALWQGEFGRALSLYERAFNLCHQLNNHLLAVRVATRLIETAAHLGKPEEAQDTLAWLRRAEQTGRVPVRPMMDWCEGALARQQEDWTTAEQRFSSSLKAAPVADVGFRLRARLYYAEARLHIQSAGPADTHTLEEHLVGAAPHHFFEADLQVMRLLAGRTGGTTRSTGALSELMAQLAPPPDHAAPYTQNLNLSVQTLGVVRVVLGGLPVHIPLSKSAEVLVWLALHGTGTRDQIVGAVWNDSNDRRYVEYFKVAVRHLRLALSGHPHVTFNPVVFLDGQYALSDRLLVATDATLAREALNSAGTEDLQRALDVYKGSFLPAAESEWAARTRLEVMELTVAAALTLGAQLHKESPLGAAAAYERAISIEPLQDAAYVELMRVHALRNDNVAARRTYLRYCRMLAEEWGRAPDEIWRNAYGPPGA